MDRTLRAALLAALIVFATVAGFGLFLQMPTAGSLIAGLVLGALAALLLWGADRRAETFHEPTPASPGFPGPPDNPDGSPSDPSDPAHREQAAEHDDDATEHDTPGDDGDDGDHQRDD